MGRSGCNNFRATQTACWVENLVCDEKCSLSVLPHPNLQGWWVVSCLTQLLSENVTGDSLTTIFLWCLCQQRGLSKILLPDSSALELILPFLLNSWEVTENRVWFSLVSSALHLPTDKIAFNPGKVKAQGNYTHQLYIRCIRKTNRITLSKDKKEAPIKFGNHKTKLRFSIVLPTGDTFKQKDKESLRTNRWKNIYQGKESWGINVISER